MGGYHLLPPLEEVGLVGDCCLLPLPEEVVCVRDCHLLMPLEEDGLMVDVLLFPHQSDVSRAVPLYHTLYCMVAHRPCKRMGQI